MSGVRGVSGGVDTSLAMRPKFDAAAMTARSQDLGFIADNLRSVRDQLDGAGIQHNLPEFILSMTDALRGFDTRVTKGAFKDGPVDIIRRMADDAIFLQERTPGLPLNLTVDAKFDARGDGDIIFDVTRGGDSFVSATLDWNDTSIQSLNSLPNIRGGVIRALGSEYQSGGWTVQQAGDIHRPYCRYARFTDAF